MTFEEWFRDYPGKDDPDAEKHARAGWHAQKWFLASPAVYADSNIREMNRRMDEEDNQRMQQNGLLSRD
jgi:hypothetical protein